MLEVEYDQRAGHRALPAARLRAAARRGANYYGPGRDALILKLYDLDLAGVRGVRTTVAAERADRCRASNPAGGAVSGPLVLGIESSCDETGVGIVRGHELLANEVASSVEQHARFGGVVPEIASRAHLEAMVPDAASGPARRADVDLTEVDGIAVTAGPGLMGALVVGLASGQGAGVRAGQAALRGQPPGRSRRRRPARARPAADALRRAARLRRAHLAAAGRRHRRSVDHRARLDHRRRGGGGVRQGRPAARPALPGRAGHRPGGDRRPARPSPSRAG